MLAVASPDTVTLTLPRKDADVTVELTLVGDGGYVVTAALDEDGNAVRLSRTEYQWVLARATAGEDEAGL